MLIADYSDVNFSSVVGNDHDQESMSLTNSHQNLVDERIDHPDAFYDYSANGCNEDLSIMRDLFSTDTFTESSVMSTSEEDTYQVFIAPDMQQHEQSMNGSTVLDEVPEVEIEAPQNYQYEGEKAEARKRSVGNDGLNKDERRQRRLLKNRIAAKECRQKKKQHVQTLRNRILQLENGNEQLRECILELNEKLARFTQTNGSRLT